MTNTISTHILDISLGLPASGVRVVLERIDDDGQPSPIAVGETDSDGRLRDLLDPSESLGEGRYRLTFETGRYFEGSRRETFFPLVIVDFRMGSAEQHYHVPLLVSPFGYSTYRGS
jgi:5-hydroxyisourate hydrolase